MKTFKKLAIGIAVISIAFSSCKKHVTPTPVGPLGPNFAYVINTIITPAILDTLEKYGTVVNAGLTPPAINGIYLIHPNYCLFDNESEIDDELGSLAGKTFDDYEYEFTNQNNGKYTIAVKFKDVLGGDSGSDSSATFISGNGSLFTIFAKTTGISKGIPYTALQVISGSVTSGGVANFQYTEYWTAKTGDATNSLVVPVGTIRIFEDQDGSSETQTTFSMITKQIQSLNSNLHRPMPSPFVLHTNN